MRRTFPRIPLERYADDAICHCRTRQEAERLKAVLEKRLADCHLTLHPQKTQVVYCKDSNRRGTHPQIHFTFLGFTFRPRLAKNRGESSSRASFPQLVRRRSRACGSG